MITNWILFFSILDFALPCILYFYICKLTTYIVIIIFILNTDVKSINFLFFHDCLMQAVCILFFNPLSILAYLYFVGEMTFEEVLIVKDWLIWLFEYPGNIPSDPGISVESSTWEKYLESNNLVSDDLKIREKTLDNEVYQEYTKAKALKNPYHNVFAYVTVGLFTCLGVVLFVKHCC